MLSLQKKKPTQIKNIAAIMNVQTDSAEQISHAESS